MSSEKQRSRVGTVSPVRTPEGGPDHGGAGDLAEGADMRQAGRAVAGLEDDVGARCSLAVAEARDDLAGLLERPCLRPLRRFAERGERSRRWRVVWRTR